MAHFLFALFVLLVLEYVICTCKPTTTINETCLDEGGIVLQLNIYQQSCPQAEAIIESWVHTAASQDPRMPASLLRLHFHDCFVNGCDASILLDDTENFVGEKTAPPNLNSLRGYEVIDTIKSDLESTCPETVSCADILAIAARDSVVLSGGPSWEVQLGRRDSLTASKAAATNIIPAPNSTLDTLIANFENIGLTLNDLVALSGAHTLGRARCSTFSSRLLSADNFSSPEVNVDFIQSLQQLCSALDDPATLAHLDLVTPSTFDNQYYVNLISGEGLLLSDQTLMTSDTTRLIVESYAEDSLLFFSDFANSMLKMGNLRQITGDGGRAIYCPVDAFSSDGWESRQ